MSDHCTDRRHAAVPRLLAVLFGLLGLTLAQPVPAVARAVSPAAAEGAASSSGSTGRGAALPMRGRIAALCGTRAARRGAGGQAGGGDTAVRSRAGSGSGALRARADRDCATARALSARPPVTTVDPADAASALVTVSAVGSVSAGPVVGVRPGSAVAEPPAAVAANVPAVRDARGGGALSSGPCGVVTTLGPPPHLGAVHGRAPPADARAGGSATA